jgi:hypothetical protein
LSNHSPVLFLERGFFGGTDEQGTDEQGSGIRELRYTVFNINTEMPGGKRLLPKKLIKQGKIANLPLLN